MVTKKKDPVDKAETKADMKGKKCELETRMINGKDVVVKTCSGEPPEFTEEEAEAAFARSLEEKPPFEIDLRGETLGDKEA